MPPSGHGDAGPRPRRTLLAGLAVAALAGLIAAAWAPRSPGFTTDSESYLDVARNLAAGDGMVQRIVDFWRPALPDPLGLWPPLYPALVAATSVAGVPPEPAARAVSIAAFVVFALALHRLARRVLPPGPALAATAVALLTPGVARAGVMAWSSGRRMRNSSEKISCSFSPVDRSERSCSLMWRICFG